MPTMRKEVIAIVCSDIHLSLSAPIWRSAEPNWFEAMKRPFTEIKQLQKKYNNCVVLCAGDIFNRWNSSPELINWAMDNLPDNFWAIPGQHDLPAHNYEDIRKSAYWTLIQSKCIHHMHPQTPTLIESNGYEFLVFGYPYEYYLEPIKQRTDNMIYVALIHEYCWIKGYSYPGAKNGKLRGGQKYVINNRYKGYDTIIFGDNHQGFVTTIGQTHIMNCGSLIRLKSDQIDYKPQVGLLYSDGSIQSYYLDITTDKFIDKSVVR